MSGVTQAVFQNQRSFGGGVEPAPTVIGQAYGGGFYAGQISTAGNGTADYYLVVGPKSSAQSSSTLAWRNTSTNDPAGSFSVINGDANTALIVADGNATVYPAAHFCNNLTVGSKSDWYLPSTMETFVLYTHLKPSTYGSMNSGSPNNYSIPQRTSGFDQTPVVTQTSVTAFQSGGSEAYDNNSYWASNEHSAGPYAYFLDFDNAQYAADYKANLKRTRGIRRVAV